MTLKAKLREPLIRRILIVFFATIVLIQVYYLLVPNFNRSSSSGGCSIGYLSYYLPVPVPAPGQYLMSSAPQFRPLFPVLFYNTGDAVVTYWN